MSFDWSKFLALAEAVYEQRHTLPDLEACCRTVSNRAYYAVHNLAYHKMTQEDSSASTSGRHENTIAYFKESPNKTRRRIGNWVDRMRIHRNNADYHETVRDGSVERQSEFSPRIASNVIADLKSL